MALQFNHKEYGSLIGSGSYQFRHYGKEIVYLYNEGDECTTLTGGWNAGTDCSLDSGWSGLNAPSLTKNSSNFYGVQSASNNSGGSIRALNKIDLTNYHRLYIECEGASSNVYANQFFGTTSVLGKIDTSTICKYSLITGDGSSTKSYSKDSFYVDISGLTGEYYIVLFLYFPSNITVYNIWLQ